MRPHKLTDLDTTPSVGPSYPTTAKKEKKPSLVNSRKGRERKKKKKKKYQL